MAGVLVYSATSMASSLQGEAPRRALQSELIHALAHLRDAPVSELKVDADSAQIRRGQAISDSFCGACHSRTGTLTGGSARIASIAV